MAHAHTMTASAVAEPVAARFPRGDHSHEVNHNLRVVRSTGLRVELIPSHRAVGSFAEKIKKGQFQIGKLGGRRAMLQEIWQAALAA